MRSEEWLLYSLSSEQEVILGGAILVLGLVFCTRDVVRYFRTKRHGTACVMATCAEIRVKKQPSRGSLSGDPPKLIVYVAPVWEYDYGGAHYRVQGAFTRRENLCEGNRYTLTIDPEQPDRPVSKNDLHDMRYGVFAGSVLALCGGGMLCFGLAELYL